MTMRGTAAWVALAAAVVALASAWGVACDPIMWSGAVTPTSVQLRLQVTASSDTIVVSQQADLSAPVFEQVVGTGMQAANPTGLTPSTKYYYGLKNAAAATPALVGKFTTHANGAFSFSVAFASCAWTGYESGVFNEIAERDPLFFVHMGDLNYENIDNDNVQVRDDSYYDVFASESQAYMFRNVPMVYMWDDHDYGPNNADGTFVGKTVAREAYQKFFPHYPLAAGSGNVPIQQAFTVGRVRFIVTDLRSEASMPGALNTTMGYAQRDWFLQELSDFASYGLVVWVNTKPWMGEPEAGVDRWPGFAEERRYISDRIVAMGVNNLISLSGDAHVLAIDSGAHMDYSTAGGAGFPVFHAAPMAQYGSSKGIGPFTEGCTSYRFYMNHQYGTMDVTDDGTNICLHWKAWRYSETGPILQYEACAPTVISGVGGGGTCDIALFPTYVYVSVALLLFALLQLAVCACCMRRQRRLALEKASEYEALPTASAENGQARPNAEPRTSVVRNPMRATRRARKNA